jgi:tetratricopeptide (TPR) repeat protein
MKLRLTNLALFMLVLAVTVLGQQAKLEGLVFDDRDRTVSGVRITALGGQAAASDRKGHFSISFPTSIRPGQATRIGVDRLNWVIYQPMFGNCVTQSLERNYEPLRVVIVPKGSPLALSPKRLSQVIAQWATERAKLTNQVGTLKQDLDQYAFLREYAKEYGFTLEQFRGAADQWAQIKESDDKEERALKEYWQNNYGRAAQFARDSAVAADEELDRANKQTTEAGSKVIRRYKLLGNAYYADHKYEEALDAYYAIEKRFETRRLSKENFAAAWSEIKLLLANTKVALGIRVNGEDSTRLLKEALADIEESASFYTAEQSPHEWGARQNTLGNVLWSVAVTIKGAEGLKYLNDAAEAYRAALGVDSRYRSSQDWAATQNNLGNVLRELGQLLAGPTSIKYLKDAVTAYNAALGVRTRAQFPEHRAITQKNLGVTLLVLSEKGEDKDKDEYLKGAIAAFRGALEINTPERFPQEWAATQNALGNALRILGERAGGTESIDYLNKAAATFRAVLKVISRDKHAQQWAATQDSLGTALQYLGERISTAEGVDRLKEAVNAFNAALEIRTRDHFPRQWLVTQNNLGNALRDMGERVSGADSGAYFNKAAAAHRTALEVATPGQLPGWWVIIQINLAKDYLQLHDWSNAEKVYKDVLQYAPDNDEAFGGLAGLYHDILFDFDKSLLLNQQWLERHRNDVAAQANFAEVLFSVGRFAECQQLINSLLGGKEVPASSETALRAIEIASLLAEGKSSQVPAKIDDLIRQIRQQPPKFTVMWGFDGTRHFIGHADKLTSYAGWLNQLFDSLGSNDRDTMLKALEEVRTKYNF